MLIVIFAFPFYIRSILNFIHTTRTKAYSMLGRFFIRFISYFCGFKNFRSLALNGVILKIL
ncbi:hypothetical protein LEP1GSC018_0804 [Leptospira kirschneri str. 2008720114]|nr:hypothetical protein LEP1GSC018_0804 [Leptospira kirschneri str. 2008720114]EMK18779.1 hypothetical protein LEP1GSC042_3939 [Leptospira kirschneri serovar Bim str. PUO 1247]EMN03608.1 hypothetical protein LEP1GSC046_0762 [Leptospira kirschneri serovar Bim str. 1051]